VVGGRPLTTALPRCYYVKDHLGSVRAVVNETGAAVGTRDYYPFGLPLPQRYNEGAPPPREDYTGHELDRQTELRYAAPLHERSRTLKAYPAHSACNPQPSTLNPFTRNDSPS
jgi:hypothetical protein